MRIIYGIKYLEVKGPTAVTIGIFDGVHRGHRKILRELERRSRLIGGKACVVTFEPHPLEVLKPHMTPPMLISLEHRMRLLKEEGVDIAAVINFTGDFAVMTPARFAEEILKKKLNAKDLLVGENFVLGKGRAGNVKNLKRIGKRLGFNVRAIKPLKSGGQVVSSTLIRKLIMSGRLENARQLLGRNVSVLGTVVRGERLGRTIGFPTANIDPHHEAIPPSGVYAVKVRIGRKEHEGVANIGFRPTFYRRKPEKGPVIEVHILDFFRLIYGKNAEVIFLKKIRQERKFKDGRALCLRIKKDIATAKDYFKKAI
ncbi:MAG: bifunctional riboflavin kinase/FAD synthetase [Candidatus Omnitrophota bacterium]|nr:bifunctional riboflavin kinase/FAD synthetase [Candidatus Omnitrophota bacterium]